ncbi:biopolymer transporter ExbD [Dyella solisilvae]|uniref:Biopolymer transporter ExbD n=1 Tax=Dyella solisilvae TaxID=1920168 RepID=A0A370KB55_9GAMM|nr:biopolymer transporter ExbD [Dyella solisilvae]RDI99886.1 biopolymer transporter ExbD [Dyella solisilvae]
MAFSARVSDAPLAQINVTPLVDVLLVLLVIVMITSPMLTHEFKLDLPGPGKTERQTEPETVHLSIGADGSMRWNDVPVDAAALEVQLAIAAHRSEPPELVVAPDDGATYQAVAGAIAAAKRQGLDRIDFMDAR